MEIFELRYFLAAATHENLHRASEALSASPASLSKAITRLEDELGVRLFRREGRGIRLTDHGRLLKERASRILRLEESARADISGLPGSVHGVIAGPEALLSRQGLDFTREIIAREPGASFELRAASDEAALAQVTASDAHLALVTADVPRGLSSRVVGEAKFVTVVGKGHPLHGAARAGRVIPVEEVLTHPFVSLALPLLGETGPKQSIDGWRDDRFPRKVAYVASSLKLLETIVFTGMAVAYLPDYFAEASSLTPLKVSGCPYVCVQKIRLVARRPEETGWINRLF